MEFGLIGRGEAMEFPTLTLAPSSGSSPNGQPYNDKKVGSLGSGR